MSANRIMAIAGRIFTQFRRDRRTLAMIVLVPAVMMSLVGHLLSDDKEPVPVAIVNADGGTSGPGPQFRAGAVVEEALRTQSGIEWMTFTSADEARASLEAREILGTVVIPADFSASLISPGGQAAISVFVEGINPTADAILRAAVARAVSAAAESVMSQLRGAQRPPMTVRVEPTLARADLTSIDYHAPAFIAAFALFFTFLLTSVSFLRERSSGTMERLGASPATRIEVMLGYLLGFIGFALVQALVLLAYAVAVLGATVEGPVWIVLLVLAVLVAGIVNLGIVLSFFARNELQVVQFIPLVFTPQMLLAGLIWPVETLHPALQALARAFPLTYAIDALRLVMIGGAGLADVGGQLLALLAFVAATVALGAAVLQKQRA